MGWKLVEPGAVNGWSAQAGLLRSWIIAISVLRALAWGIGAFTALTLVGVFGTTSGLAQVRLPDPMSGA
jgi:hypothetical protein